MKEYHPPLTGLESYMEEELAREAGKPEDAVVVAHELHAEEARSKETLKSEMDHRIEEAMHLDL